jgi:hypothetical protein
MHNELTVFESIPVTQLNLIINSFEENGKILNNL